MENTAFIFPGQGAQVPGMGKEFYDNFECSRKIFDQASALTGIDMKELCFTENDRLDITEYTQIALLTTSMAIWAVLDERDHKSAVTAGLSLGEYGALVACGAMTFEEAAGVVRKRGIYMQEAVPLGVGTMAAVLGLDGDKIADLCKQEAGTVQVANYNCPGQIVISGEKEAVQRVSEHLKEAGAKRVVPLNVSGPFHSEMLSEAGAKLADVLKPVKIHEFSIPYVTNVTAEYVNNPEDVKDLLVRQVSSSVLWQQSVQNMIEHGIDHFIEIGPGKTLSSFVRKIDRTKKVTNIEKVEDLDKLSI